MLTDIQRKSFSMAVCLYFVPTIIINAFIFNRFFFIVLPDINSCYAHIFLFSLICGVNAGPDQKIKSPIRLSSNACRGQWKRRIKH